MEKTKTCKDRIETELKDRIEDIKQILKADDPIEELNNIALSWDKENGKLELSWGGPADGFYFTPNASRVIYYFQDWFDGAEVNLWGEDLTRLQELYETCLNF